MGANSPNMPVCMQSLPSLCFSLLCILLSSTQHSSVRTQSLTHDTTHQQGCSTAAAAQAPVCALPPRCRTRRPRRPPAAPPGRAGLPLQRRARPRGPPWSPGGVMRPPGGEDGVQLCQHKMERSGARNCTGRCVDFLVASQDVCPDLMNRSTMLYVQPESIIKDC